MRLPILITAIGCTLVAQAVHAKGVVLSGKRVSVETSKTRGALLRSTARALVRQRLPGYATLFQAKNGRQGATLIATVESSKQMKGWYDGIGRSSVGIATSVPPNVSHGSGYIRLGETLYYFKALRSDKPDKQGNRYVPVDIRKKQGTLTEATFPVSQGEMTALKAFYKARSLQLIKDDQGKAIEPPYKMIGARGGFTNESCAHTCTSALTDGWMKVFLKNLPALRAYGLEHKVQELAAIPASAKGQHEMIEQINSFARRTAGQKGGRKELIRANFDKAPLLTIFNAGIGADPLRNLSWAGGKWNGLAEPKFIPDRPNEAKPLQTYTSERVSLKAFCAMGSSCP